MMKDEGQLLEELRKHNWQAFKVLIYDHAEQLTTYAHLLLKDSIKAHNIVDDLFLRLFNQGFIEATIPLEAFLEEEVRRECVRHS